MRRADREDAPLIGVTGPDGWYHLAWRFTRWALGRAGARVLRLTPEGPRPAAPLDGVVIGGGEDIDPALYAAVDDGAAGTDRARDRFERTVIEDALARGTPVLGICRGAQLLNVVLGGTLHADVRGMRRRTSNRRTVLARKTVTLASGCRLRRLMGREHLRVNSLHHQAVDRLGRGVRAVARDRDGLVQAIECDGGGFRIGVQWHPEYLLYHERQRRLFAALAAAARRAS